MPLSAPSRDDVIAAWRAEIEQDIRTCKAVIATYDDAQLGTDAQNSGLRRLVDLLRRRHILDALLDASLRERCGRCEKFLAPQDATSSTHGRKLLCSDCALDVDETRA